MIEWQFAMKLRTWSTFLSKVYSLAQVKGCYYFVFLIIEQANQVFCFPNSFLVQSDALEVGNVIPDWHIFEFITEKEGRCGPTKAECIGY